MTTTTNAHTGPHSAEWLAAELRREAAINSICGSEEWTDLLTRAANAISATEKQCPADPTRWTQAEAIALCAAVEAVCPQFGCHVALTGGLLYKTGPRKDCDLLFYRIRQTPKIDIDGLWAALAEIGLTVLRGFGWCYKAKYQGRGVDCFFPEEHAKGKADTADPCESSE